MRRDSLPCTSVVILALLTASCMSDGHATREEPLDVCHGYGCAFRSKLRLTEADETRFDAVMAAARKSPSAERAAMSEAVRYFENRTRQVTGVVDQPKSKLGASGVRGQMDCIDESTNTRTLLKHLEKRGLLKHHSVAMIASRGFLVDGRYPHSTAVIRDASGVKWAVDSWYAPMGAAPDILRLSDWLPRGFMASGELTAAERRSGL